MWRHDEFGVCSNGRVHVFSCAKARSEEGDCGPSGRYWEPREKGDE